MKKLLATLVTLVMIASSLAVLTSCASDGATPTIGENGNWFIGDVDTGISATGPKGDKGDKGDKGPTGNAGAAGVNGANGANGATPVFRWNEDVLEVSYNGGASWSVVPVYEPSDEPTDDPADTPEAPAIDPNLLDDSLTEYAYPMNTITPAEGCIMLSGDNKNVYMVDPENPDHRVAFIYIEGTVFTGAKFTGNANNWMGWFWLDELPELGETIDYAGDMVNIHETARPSGSQTGAVGIQEGAKWLCVWYQDDADGTAGTEVKNYLPEGILFVK